jgi:hypothetical protein
MKNYIDRDMILEKLTDIKRGTDSNFVYACADTIKEFVESLDYITLDEVKGNGENQNGNIH